MTMHRTDHAAHAALVSTARRQRLTPDERAAIRQASLDRALQSPSLTNFGTILEEFAARGIAVEQIRPRENVFTYNAWQALGRQVRKGEHGVRICVWIECGEGDEAKRLPRHSTVFHVSQTDELAR